MAPIINEEYKEQVTKRMKDVGFMNIVAGYVSSVFQDFESYLRTEVDLVEDDIYLVLEECNSSFLLMKYNQVFTLLKIIRKPFLTFSNSNIQDLVTQLLLIEYDDITMKTELVVKNGIKSIRFDEKSFFLVLSLVLLQAGIINNIINTLAKKLLT